MRSFGYAFEGVASVARTQPNFVFHLVAAVVALVLSFALGITRVELALVVLAITMVLAAEALNTAIEAVADLLSPGYHPLVKRAKDAAAAGVLFTALGAALVGAIIFGPRIVSGL